jgi:hypothetical protein
LEDELADGRGTTVLDRDAVSSESRRETAGEQRLPGSPAGEQPGGVAVGRGDHVRAAAGQREQQLREWSWDRDGRVAQSEEDLAIDVAHVVDREPDDAADRLRVEQQEETGDPLAHGGAVVTEQAPNQRETTVLRDRGRLARRP